MCDCIHMCFHLESYIYLAIASLQTNLNNRGSSNFFFLSSTKSVLNKKKNIYGNWRTHKSHTNNKKKNSYFILSVWLARLLCVYKFPWVVLLPRNSNSWQGFLQIGDRDKPADAGTLQFALSFWLRQHLVAQACRRQSKGKRKKQCSSQNKSHPFYHEAVLGRQPFL